MATKSDTHGMSVTVVGKYIGGAECKGRDGYQWIYVEPKAGSLGLVPCRPKFGKGYEASQLPGAFAVMAGENQIPSVAFESVVSVHARAFAMARANWSIRSSSVVYATSHPNYLVMLEKSATFTEAKKLDATSWEFSGRVTSVKKINPSLFEIFAEIDPAYCPSALLQSRRLQVAKGNSVSGTDQFCPFRFLVRDPALMLAVTMHGSINASGIVELTRSPYHDEKTGREAHPVVPDHDWIMTNVTK